MHKEDISIAEILQLSNGTGKEVDCHKYSEIFRILRKSLNLSAGRLTLPPGKSRYPFYRRLNGPQGQSGWAENLDPTGIPFQTIQPIVSRYTD